MSSEKQPSSQPPEDSERRTRVRYVELNGVRYRSRESSRVDARGNLLERVNELYTTDGSNKVFLQREAFDPELGLLTEVTRVDYTDGKPAEDKEEYRYRERSAGLAFFRYVRRLAGVKTVEQTEKYGSGSRRPEELERLEYDQDGELALRRLEELDPESGRLLKAATEFYENGSKVLEVVEVFSPGNGRLIKRLSTRYEAECEVSHEVEDLTDVEDAAPPPSGRPSEPILAQVTPMSIPKAETAAEKPTAPDPAVSPAALLAGFIYAKSIEDNRPPPTPPAYFEAAARDKPAAREAADTPTSSPAPAPERPAAVEMPANKVETPLEKSSQTPKTAAEISRARGPEIDAAAGDPEKRDLDAKSWRDVPDSEAARLSEQERMSELPPEPQPGERRPGQAAEPASPPAKTQPKQQHTARVALIAAVVITMLAATYYIFSSI
ncbi:hypothetical protein F4X86_01015 [Candidatus Saccharibacteria bacterium]|nr:hypothetical protein [Candidatus Saccharibacteria bacterium]